MTVSGRIRGATAILSLALTAMLGGGCQPESSGEPPPAVAPTREAITYYGRMILVDHRGPKAQIHLAAADEPLWFSQVRDAVAFTLSPEEPGDIAAIYVTDMAQADGWAQPQHWMPAGEALYVIDSGCHGGMGALEAVPFSERDAAEAFVRLHGGEIVAWDGIPERYILERSMQAAGRPGMMGMHGEGACERLAADAGEPP